MSDERRVFGMTVKFAEPLDLLLAPLFGKFLSRGAGMAFYEWKDNIVVVEDEPEGASDNG